MLQSNHDRPDAPGSARGAPGDQQTLRQRDEFLRAMVACSPVPIISIDVDANVVTWCESAERTFGWSADEVIGKPLPIVPPDKREESAALTKRALSEGGFSGVEVVRQRKDGSPVVLSLSVAPIDDGAGKVIGIMASLEDITERKRAEAERERLQAELVQAQKMESIGRLAGGLAHDFNNLLTVINGYSKLLLARLSPGDPLRNTVTEIHKAGERAAGLTRQLLAFGRKQVMQPRALDLNRLIEEMLPMVERLAGEAVELRVALNAPKGMVRADPHQLEQAVMNLVANARDAMPDGGVLLMETSEAELGEGGRPPRAKSRMRGYVILSVSDTGAGMDEEELQRVFEPFFSAKGSGRGTGLGLAMVQGIVAQSGGWVDVHSKPGEGTCFQVCLPAAGEAETAAEPIPAGPPPGGTETILVVEDKEEVRHYTVAVLESYGYRAIEAGNAGEALLIGEQEPGEIHLLLTDVVMPRVSGRTLAGRLEKLRPGIKVLFMSGDAGATPEPARGGEEFLRKPFSPEELAGRVRAVLGSPAPKGRILVADDEAPVRGLLRAVLEQAGYEVLEAADGKEAIRQAQTSPVDLVITDLVMPEQEGIETIRTLRRDVPGVAIIAISGAFEGQFLKTARLLGADVVLSKPVSPETLLAKVAGVLAGR